MTTLATVVWPANRVGEALSVLARSVGAPEGASDVANPPTEVSHDERMVERWLERTADVLGATVQRRQLVASNLDGMLEGAAPALWPLRSAAGELQFVASLFAREGYVVVATPSNERQPISRRVLHAWITAAPQERVAPKVRRTLERLGIADRQEASHRLVDLYLGEEQVEALVVGPREDRSLLAQLVRTGAGKWLAAMSAIHVVSYTLSIGSWFLLAKSMLGIKFDAGAFFGWLLTLLTAIPLWACEGWWKAKVGLAIAGNTRRRMFEAVMRTPEHEAQKAGAGQLLARIVEAQSAETMAIAGGLGLIVGGTDLLVIIVLLANTSGGWPILLLLLGWVVLLATGMSLMYRRGRAWSDARVALTNGFVARVLGYRTRMTQQPAERWHEGEDGELARYGVASQKIDAVATFLGTVAVRGWLILAGVLTIPLLWGNPAGIDASFLIVIGAILLASRALARLSNSFSALSDAGIAYRLTGPLLRHARAAPPAGAPNFALTSAPDPNGELLSAAGVGFTYDGSSAPALRDCTFRIAADDRILLVGESGAGKSTLASLIGGLKRPTEGLLSIGGLDMTSIGWRTWRQHVMIAPQFSQNHLLCGTLAFNLLLGRRWPPQAQDLEEARLVSRELGLGDLLRRMPLGLDQPVGETGWQLSHGEKSRVFLARALLAKADLLIVDESLGALDPATTDMAFRCVLNRSRALLVIAHA